MERVQILDHGYLQFIERWGSDERIIEAARMSTGKGFLGWEAGVCLICDGNPSAYENDNAKRCYGCEGKGTIVGDKNLLRRLWVKKHAGPFEMAGAVVEVAAPIMIFREWHRHRTQSYNEMSARYVPLPNVNYIPSVERLLIGSDSKNKQAGTVAGAGILDEAGARQFQGELRLMYEHQEALYQIALKRGVPKELARVHLPVGRYSRMRASANLRNWLGFLTLRMSSDAQWEIRMYANAVGDLIAELFPRTWELFRGPPEGAAAAPAVGG